MHAVSAHDGVAVTVVAMATASQNRRLQREQLEAAVVRAHRAGVDPYKLRDAATRRDLGALSEWLSEPDTGPPLPTERFILLGGLAGYPQRLAAGHRPPPLLYGVGNKDVLAKPGILIAGDLSGGLDDTVVEVASAAGHVGAPVVCGAAVGAAGMCATTAIQFQVPVILVVAGGVDMIASGQARRLAADIVAAGGAVVSESPFGEPPDADVFATRLLARHRILAALSCLGVVTGGSLPSDTANSVWAMARLGRPIVAVRDRALSRAPAPAKGRNSKPSSALIAALTHATLPTVEALESLGCPREVAHRILTNGAPVAHAIAEASEDVGTIVDILYRLSPDTRPSAPPL